MKNFYQINKLFWRGGHPTVEDYRTLFHVQGIRGILDLCDNRDMVDPLRCAYHEARLEKLLRKYDYKNVPMGFPVASVMQLETVMIALIGIEKPALVHCARGADRTGLVAAAVRIEYDSWPVNRAVEEMHDPKFGSYNFASYERVLREWAEE